VEPARPVPPPESPIREEELTSKSRPAPSLPPAPEKLPPQEKPRESVQPPEPAVPPPLADDSSLLAKITPATPPQRAASLRLTEQGRKLLEAGDAARAVSRFERTISIDSTNPYGYFYLAKAQHRLGRHKESLNFLDVAESRLAGEPFWLSEVHALRGENFRALGMTEKAEASYAQALRLNSGNRTALEARSKLSGESQPASP
jgi:tetratricopeptide (TPR) repeat protein